MNKILTHVIGIVALTGLTAIPAEAQWVKREKVNSRVTVNFGDCPGCNFSGKDLHGLRIKQSNLTGSLFNRANLSGGEILVSDLTGAHFKKAFLARVEGDRVMLKGANMSDATISESVINNSYFVGATLSGADLTSASFTNSDFSGANLSGVSAVKVILSGSHFLEAKFDGANLTGALLDNAKFNKTVFGSANLEGADLTSSSFLGADLSRAVGLKQAQLDLACGDSQTQLPFGYSLPYCTGLLDSPLVPHDKVHPSLIARDHEITMRVDRAIAKTESLMLSADPSVKKELQKIHSDLMAVRRKVED